MDRKVSIQQATDFASVTGKGVTGKIGGKSVALGNAKLMTDLGIKLGALRRGRERSERSGH